MFSFNEARWMYTTYMKIRENNQEIQHTYVLIIDCSLILKSFQLIPEPFPFYYHLMRNFILKISKGTKLQKQIDQYHKL